MPIVIVATENVQKVKAVYKAFMEYFDEEVIMETVKVESGVPKQPVNSETIRGAEKRINNVKRKVNKKYDYIVAVEGGIMYLGRDWYNMQFVLIEDSTGKRSSGISQAFCIPHKYVKSVINSSINQVFVKQFQQPGDGLSVITHGIIERRDCIKQGTIMALAGLLNGDIW